MTQKDYAAENTVSALYQLRGTGPLFLDAHDGRPRILFIGNSITKHGRKPEIGWEGDWGMAASAPEKDYVRLVMNGVREVYPNAACAIFQQATWERAGWLESAPDESARAARNWAPDAVVLRLGENTAPEQLARGDYAQALASLARACGADRARYLVTDEFWPNDLKDAALFRAAEALGASFVRISDLGAMDEMKAYGRFAHAGVAAHPGDEGMKAIAARILPALLALLRECPKE